MAKKFVDVRRKEKKILKEMTNESLKKQRTLRMKGIVTDLAKTIESEGGKEWKEHSMDHSSRLDSSILGEDVEKYNTVELDKK